MNDIIFRTEDFIIEDGAMLGLSSTGREKLFKNESNLEINGDYLDETITSIGDPEKEEFLFLGVLITELRIKNLPDLEMIEENAFTGVGLQFVYLENLPSLESIEAYSFNYNCIRHLFIDDCDELKFICYEAFAYNQIYHLNLSKLKNLTYVGALAFGNNRIEEYLPPRKECEVSRDAFLIYS